MTTKVTKVTEVTEVTEVTNKSLFKITCNKSCRCSLKCKPYDQCKRHEDDKKKSRIKGGVLFLHRSHDTCHILLVQSRGRLWGLPKGSREKGESTVECALRELKEETGIERGDSSILGSLHNRGNSTYFVISEKGDLKPSTLLIDKHDSSGVGWITIECLQVLLTCNLVRLTADCYSIIKNFLSVAGFADKVELLSPNMSRLIYPK